MTDKFYTNFFVKVLGFKEFKTNFISKPILWCISWKYRKYKYLTEVMKENINNIEPYVYDKCKQFDQKDPDIKIIEIAKYIDKHVKYVAEIGDEWGSPVETLKSGFGDCENYHILLYTMARYSGITNLQTFCWIGNVLKSDGTKEGHFAFLYYSTKTNQLYVIDLTYYKSIGSIEYRTPFKHQGHRYIETSYIFNEEVCFARK